MFFKSVSNSKFAEEMIFIKNYQELVNQTKSFKTIDK